MEDSSRPEFNFNFSSFNSISEEARRALPQPPIRLLSNRGGGGNRSRRGQTRVPPPFKDRIYQVYPVVMADKEQLEKGNKIILPPQAFDQLTHLRICYPMMFKVTNATEENYSTHCGVMEFTANDGVCYMPYWMMKNLQLEAGKYVKLSTVGLRKGEFVQLRPHKTEFTQLYDPKSVLEEALSKNYSCLSQGDVISIQNAEGDSFQLDVLQVKPGKAVSVVDTDIKVDFAEPRDYQEYQQILKEKVEKQKIQEAAVNEQKQRDEETQTQQEKENEQHQSQQQEITNTQNEPHSGTTTAQYFASLAGGRRLGSRTGCDENEDTAMSEHQATQPTEPQIIERIGKFDYIFRIDPTTGVKKLVKRVAISQ